MTNLIFIDAQLMTEQKTAKERQFKGVSLSERKAIRLEKLIAAGIQVYGTRGFFAATVKDICLEAKLTERYFYESFKKSEQLFQTIFLKLVEELRQNVLEATEQNAENPKKMIEAGLMALLNTLHENPKMARIIYIDGLLVQELNNQATLQETLARFDRMIHHILMIAKPNSHRTEYEISLVASGLNGYVTQIAIRWVMNNFQQSKEDVLSACYWPFLALFNQDPDEK
ncbi:TetR family transcriptional regulator [Acinetobacter sp. Ac_877]|uniref:TetR/AcrR family transcriptional regulator n=1 Tax=Acinetobacter portensis TaxID=1839785 RepID=UPI00128BB7FD|nr:TetR family transcriptional regulator [Acinetobacter portensis]MPW41017.1 TetR family transcriptional regulator [Acinetobacter portensis]